MLACFCVLKQKQEIENELYIRAEGRPQNLSDIRFQPAHRDRWLIISFMVDTKPEGLINDLNDAGWSKDHADMLPLIESEFEGRTQVSLHAIGSGVFRSWTDDERRMHMANARRVLRKHGYKSVPHWKLTLADMM